MINTNLVFSLLVDITGMYHLSPSFDTNELFKTSYLCTKAIFVFYENRKLIVYPKGNKKDNGKGFISMYVEIDSKSLKSEQQCEVFAELIFFVYNKKENKYFTVQGKLLVIYICLFTYISVIIIFYVFRCRSKEVQCT